MLNRRSASFRHNYDGSTLTLALQPRTISTNKLNKYPSKSFSTIKLQANQKNGTGFKLVDMINNQKNKITSIDPSLSNLNATLKKICRSNTTPPSQNQYNERTYDHHQQKCMPFESFAIDANTYHEFVAKNQPLPIDVNELRDAVVHTTSRNMANNTLADIQSVHASTCNLVTALRQSNQSIENPENYGGNSIRFGQLHNNSNSTMNLRNGSLRSHKGRSKRSNSEQFHSSYYHFQNVDGEMDNNSNTGFDSILLPPHSTENHKLPWKHRQCPSISSSNSSNSSNFSSKCQTIKKFSIFVFSFVLFACYTHYTLFDTCIS